MNKLLKIRIRPLVILIVCLVCMAVSSEVSAAGRFYYQIKIYHVKTQAQEDHLDDYLKNAYLPALHRMGIKDVGVFKPVENDTAIMRIYVFTPFPSWAQLENVDEKLMADQQYIAAGKDYIGAASKNPPFSRIETIVLRAFPKMIEPAVPNLSANKTDRVYELRSYESATEAYNLNKVHMFNDGNEVTLFKRLNFNAVFYAEVLAGSHMPNLMYMTTFNSKEDRDKHWDTFTNDSEWKTLVAKPEFQNNVSKADILFLHPTAYSDI